MRFIDHFKHGYNKPDGDYFGYHSFLFSIYVHNYFFEPKLKGTKRNDSSLNTYIYSVKLNVPVYSYQT